MLVCVAWNVYLFHRELPITSLGNEVPQQQRFIWVRGCNMSLFFVASVSTHLLFLTCVLLMIPNKPKISLWWQYVSVCVLWDVHLLHRNLSKSTLGFFSRLLQFFHIGKLMWAKGGKWAFLFACSFFFSVSDCLLMNCWFRKVFSLVWMYYEFVVIF
jgi:hypothetical protein